MVLTAPVFNLLGGFTVGNDLYFIYVECNLFEYDIEAGLASNGYLCVCIPRMLICRTLESAGQYRTKFLRHPCLSPVVVPFTTTAAAGSGFPLFVPDSTGKSQRLLWLTDHNRFGALGF
ncbi:MAG: hypothetical protein MZV63_43525 [Marinilabiliales bacterium]|nr:hypothetical protein [Marinilabiliales bacterium]